MCARQVQATPVCTRSRNPDVPPDRTSAPSATITKPAATAARGATAAALGSGAPVCGLLGEGADGASASLVGSACAACFCMSVTLFNLGTCVRYWYECSCCCCVRSGTTASRTPRPQLLKSISNQNNWHSAAVWPPLKYVFVPILTIHNGSMPTAGGSHCGMTKNIKTRQTKTTLVRNSVCYLYYNEWIAQFRVSALASQVLAALSHNYCSRMTDSLESTTCTRLPRKPNSITRLQQ